MRQTEMPLKYWEILLKHRTTYQSSANKVHALFSTLLLHNLHLCLSKVIVCNNIVWCLDVGMYFAAIVRTV